MRSVVAWTETPPEKDGIKNVCYDICFKPDGSQLVAAVGNRVLVYEAADGELLHALKGHKGPVYCVAYAWNGKRFASGGADNTIIIWTNKAEGILKYSHNESIQCLAYNPVTQQLASGTASDLGLWSPEQKAVVKHKVTSKILSMAWTVDGLLLALGSYDGSVSIRDKAGNEKTRFVAGQTPAWSVAWSPQDQPVLAVGCLEGHLRFFTSGGTQKFKDRQLQGDPLSLAYFGGDYLLVAGNDKTVQIMTKEGISMASIPCRSNWVWRLAPRPRANFVALASEDGSITMLQLIFSTVHGLYGDRYAYRDSMTDVVIQHLITDQKVRIKCRDYVKKVAVYRDRVAVQLPSRAVLYELAGAAQGGVADDTDMQYRSAAKISASWECNLLVVASGHFILCQDRKLQLYDYEGVKQREWSLDAVIRYIKVAGGPARREALLVGLKDGQVVKVFVDNPFPIPLLRHPSGVRCLDVSPTRTKVALVDESAKVVVYDLEQGPKMIFEAEGANSVAWNADCESAFCYSGGGSLTIRTADFPPHSQKMQGFVVGFKGSKVFCLQYSSMQTVDVPQSASMFRYLEQKDWGGAYSTACLGVTDADWRALALAALQEMEVDVARQAFIRVRDLRAVELVDRVAASVKGGVARGLLLGEVMAWQGRYQEAARLYVNEGRLDKVLEMFSALRQFDEAKKWADEYSRLGRLAGGGPAGAGDAAVADLMRRQAEWSEESANYEAAAEMYIRAKRYHRAIPLLIRHGWWDRLLALVRSLSRERDAPLLAQCATALRRAGQYGASKEALLKLGDSAALADLEVANERWDDAALLAVSHPELGPMVHLPHAEWLCAKDRFDEARAAYREGGRPDLARRLLEGAAEAAVRRRRFGDASHAHYRLAVDALQDISRPPRAMSPSDRDALVRFSRHYDRAELYAAYCVVHERAARPFRTADDAMLMGAARFLLSRLLAREAPPPGISLVTTLLAAAKVAVSAGAYKLARFAYGKLQALALPPAAQADVDLQSVAIRAAPFADAEELAPACHRCGTTNPLVNAQGDVCVGCGASFHCSPLTWDAQPVVEFELEDGIGEDEAMALIGEDAGDAAALASVSRPEGKAEVGDGQRASDGAAGRGGGGGGADVLRLDEPAGPGRRGAGLGVAGGGSALDDAWSMQAVVPRVPIRLDRAALRQLRAREVLVRRWPCPHLPAQWFRVMDEEAAVVVGPCGHFFEADEFEMALLEEGVAPFSREKVAEQDGG